MSGLRIKKKAAKDRVLIKIADFEKLYALEQSRLIQKQKKEGMWLEFLIPPDMHIFQVCFFLEQRGIPYVADLKGTYPITYKHPPLTMPMDRQIITQKLAVVQMKEEKRQYQKQLMNRALLAGVSPALPVVKAHQG